MILKRPSKKYIEFKEPGEVENLPFLNPWILIIMADVSLYCMQKNLPFIVTRTWDDPIENVSVSQTHYGRAFDMSVKGWDDHNRDIFVKEFDNKYKQVAAISASDNQKRLIIYHDAGAGPHFHFQVSDQSLHTRLSIVYKN
jgi:hypothetical protein